MSPCKALQNHTSFSYSVGESLVVQLQEVLEYVVVGREDGLAERLGYPQVLQRDLSDELEMAYQPHLVVFARVELWSK